MQRAELQITRYWSGSHPRAAWQRGSVRSVDYTNNIRRNAVREGESGKEIFIRE